MLLSASSTAVMMYLLINTPTDPTTHDVLLFLTGMLLRIGYSACMVYPMFFL